MKTLTYLVGTLLAGQQSWGPRGVTVAQVVNKAKEICEATGDDPDAPAISVVQRKEGAAK